MFASTKFQDQNERKKQGSRWSTTEVKTSDDVIAGFELDARDEASSSLRAFFPPPEIPKDWQPKFLRLKPSRFEQEKTLAKNLTPSERRTMVCVAILKLPH